MLLDEIVDFQAAPRHKIFGYIPGGPVANLKTIFQYEADQDLFPSAEVAPRDIFDEIFPPDDQGEPQQVVVEHPIADPEGIQAEEE